ASRRSSDRDCKLIGPNPFLAPFNVFGPLTFCLNFGVHSTSSLPPLPHPTIKPHPRAFGSTPLIRLMQTPGPCRISAVQRILRRAARSGTSGLKIATGRGIERGAEGGDESARALIAGIERGLLHWRAGAETTKRMQEARLSAPSP